LLYVPYVTREAYNIGFAGENPANDLFPLRILTEFLDVYVAELVTPPLDEVCLQVKKPQRDERRFDMDGRETDSHIQILVSHERARQSVLELRIKVGFRLKESGVRRPGNHTFDFRNPMQEIRGDAKDDSISKTSVGGFV